LLPLWLESNKGLPEFGFLVAFVVGNATRICSNLDCLLPLPLGSNKNLLELRLLVAFAVEKQQGSART